MSEIAIGYHTSATEFAEQLASEFALRDFDVLAGPERLSSGDGTRQPRQLTRLANFACVLLMSKELYRFHRDVVETFLDAIRAGHSNVYVISLDSDWQKIRDDALLPLKAVSYFPEPKKGIGHQDPKELAYAIISKAYASAVSQLTKDRFQHLLRSSYDSIEQVLDISEQKGRIAFSVFDCAHRLTGTTETYLVLYPSAGFEAVRSYLADLHPEVLNTQNRLFVVRSEPQHELTVKQQQTLTNLFPGAPIRFESMVSKRKLRGERPHRLIEPDEILIPQRWAHRGTPDSPTVSTDRVFDYCCDAIDASAQRRITILNGSGGAGKTHFVRFLHDKLLDKNKEVFFLSAASLTEARQDASIGSLYDIYKLACAADNDVPEIGREVFDIKFLVDDPIIIVDGLEEIITMMGDKFVLDRFYSDCLEKAKGSANGRIIITTRDMKWPDSIDDYVESFSIQPFDLDQGNQFFDKTFPRDERRRQVAKRVYQEVAQTETAIPPLFCSLIALEVQKSEALNRIEARVNGGEYRSISGLEALLRGIVEREEKLGIKWEAASTFDALGKLARASFSGPVDLNVAVELFGKTLPFDTSTDLAEAVRHFIFLRHHAATNSLTFRYDFLRTVFLAHELIRAIGSMDLKILDDEGTQVLLSKHFVPGSDVQDRVITAAVNQPSENFISVLEMIIQDLSKGFFHARSEQQTRLIASNLFFLRLSIDQQVRTIADATELLTKLFGDPGDPRVLNRFSLMYFNQDNKRSYRFDLKGRILRGCWFVGFRSDKLLEADNQTIFNACRFERCLSERSGKWASLWQAEFDSHCYLDDEFRHAQIDLTAGQVYSLERKTAELKRFLKQFSSGQAFSKNRHRDSLSGLLKGSSVDKIIAALRREGLVTEITDRAQPEVALSSKGRTLARRFVLDALVSPEIERVLRDL